MNKKVLSKSKVTNNTANKNKRISYHAPFLKKEQVDNILNSYQVKKFLLKYLRA